MRNNVLPEQEQVLNPDPILKLTALLYLQEALVEQRYESCRELIDTAKNLGISQDEISAVIGDYLGKEAPSRQESRRY